MLIEPKTIEPNDVITLKMLGGDEIVARFMSDNGHQIKVKKPHVVAMAQQGFGLIPYMFTVDPETVIEISQSNIIFYAKTLPDVAKAYTKQTSGIMMP